MLEKGERNADEMDGYLSKVLPAAAGCTIGRKRRLRRKKWISEETWNVIRKRAEAKLRNEMYSIDDQGIELA